MRYKGIKVNYTSPVNALVETFPCTNSNRITKEYYNHLVGEINRGTILKAVCSVESLTYGTMSYYLISQL